MNSTPRIRRDSLGRVENQPHRREVEVERLSTPNETLFLSLLICQTGWLNSIQKCKSAVSDPAPKVFL